MKNYIATWVYLDSKDEKSKYPNNKGNSTSSEFQSVYWRCIVLFFESSLRYHKNENHVLFTNTKNLPVVDGLDLNMFFSNNNIEVISLKNKYPLPNDYYGQFRNQYFEFTIIDHFSDRINDEDTFLLLDSDCVFTKPLYSAFDKLQKESAMTYIVDYEEDYEIHGVTGNNMKEIFSDFGVKLDKNPYYSGGEVLFAKGKFIKNVAKDFPILFKNMLDRHASNAIKFNEEAHVLSYYYYKHEALLGGMDSYIKRIWTNKNYFRNVEKSDKDLAIWHVPNEKKTGINRIFKEIAEGENIKTLDDKSYQKLLFENLLKESNYKFDYFSYFKNYLNKTFQKIGLIGK
ncbi:hypothetical protein [uncultured Maribacter sp.]|uniref:hypothetical protein n=1 Tax=uncultured Maribacter sp. TaxID=431308 RepID=UPI00260425C9|nr:hypothetical protein [uncultured Maribacter sp.]